MIIDIHGHVSAPNSLYAYKSGLLASRGSHGKGAVHYTTEQLEAALHATGTFGDGHLDLLDRYGTDLQLISPRPFQLMHSEKPSKIVHWFNEACNQAIYEDVKLHPDRFVGIAGLAQPAGDPIENALPELEQWVKLGFRGCIVNPDPYENSGIEPPGMGDRYWYPLYEKLCELDVPAMLHGVGSRSERTSYSTHFLNEETIAIVHILQSDVFKDFPTLKLIVPHGGGAVPYQLGRFQSGSMRAPEGQRFSDKMRNLYFDSCLYTKEALELLIKVVGADRVMFATECPGTGSAGKLDNLKPHIDGFDSLSAADKKLIFEDTAKKVFGLKV